MSDQSDQLYRIHSRIAATNTNLASALSDASTFTDTGSTKHAVLVLDRLHSDLVESYYELSQAIDWTEVAIDDLSDGTRETPRQIKNEHADRLEEQYEEPVLHLALMLLEHNRREWLHRKPETNGADAVRRHGLTENQRSWLNDLQDAWGAYDG